MICRVSLSNAFFGKSSTQLLGHFSDRTVNVNDFYVGLPEHVCSAKTPSPFRLRGERADNHDGVHLILA